MNRLNPCNTVGVNAFAIWREFFERTSAHGLNHVIKGGSAGSKTFWAFISSLSLGAILVHIGFITNKYYEFNVQEYKETIIAPIPFPAVTVCNLNPMSSANARTIRRNKTSRLGPIEQYLLKNKINLKQFDEKGKIIVSRPMFESMGDEVYTVSHQLNDFVVSCRYANYDCKPLGDHFTRILNGIYFSCYTFQVPAVDKQSILQPGPDEGLSLILYLENDMIGMEGIQMPYTSWTNVANSEGARLVIHQPDTFPHPELEGTDLPPGHSTSVGLEAKHHQRLAHPYGNCTNTEYIEETRSRYTRSTCIQMWHQQRIIDKCKCVSIRFPRPLNNDQIYCGELNIGNMSEFHKRVECEANEYYRSRYDTAVNSHCRHPCTGFRYTQTLSMAAWPQERFRIDFFNRCGINSY